MKNKLTILSVVFLFIVGNNYLNAQSVPQQVVPVNGSTWESTTTTLYWLLYNTYSTVGFSVQVGLSESNFTDSYLVINTTSSGNGSGSYGIPSGMLAVNIKYYWRIGFNGNYSPVWSFTPSVGSSGGTPIVLLPPNQTSPQDSIINVSLNPSFNWNSVSGATSYRIQVSQSNIYLKTVADVSNIATTSYVIKGLTSASTYFWRIRTANSMGVSNWTGSFIFTTESPLPARPTVMATNITSVSFTESWNAVTGATGYYLDVATDSSFTNIVTAFNNKDVRNVTTYTVTGINPGTKYYFRVKAYNASGTGSNSGSSGVTTLLNIAAILINIEATPIQYTLRQSLVQVSNTIQIQDNIHLTLASATVSVSGNYNPAQDLLIFSGQPEITGTWNSANGSIILKGNTTPAAYQYAIRTIQYQNTAFSPTTPDRTISYTVNDGYDNSNIQSRTIGFTITGVEGLASRIPVNYELYQNYPNPFNPSTIIRFALPQESNVKIIVFNILGEEVVRLVEGVQSAGYHQIVFDASKLSSGFYMYRIISDGFLQTKKMLLLK